MSESSGIRKRREWPQATDSHTFRFRGTNYSHHLMAGYLEHS